MGDLDPLVKEIQIKGDVQEILNNLENYFLRKEMKITRKTPTSITAASGSSIKTRVLGGKFVSKDTLPIKYVIEKVVRRSGIDFLRIEIQDDLGFGSRFGMKSKLQTHMSECMADVERIINSYDSPKPYPPEENIFSLDRLQPPASSKKSNFQNNFTFNEIQNEISTLKKRERMIDTKKIKKALEKDDIEKANKLLFELKQKYDEYKSTIDDIESLDNRKSRLAVKLADGEIDRQTYNDASKSIRWRKSDLEEELNRLRKEVIYEDYQKPF